MLSGPWWYFRDTKNWSKNNLNLNLWLMFGLITNGLIYINNEMKSTSARQLLNSKN